jgi:hypothetical protein
VGAEGAQNIRLTVTEPNGRIDRYIAAQVPGLSRSRIEQLLADGHILLNNAVPRKSVQPVEGDVIDVIVPAAAPSSVDAEETPTSRSSTSPRASWFILRPAIVVARWSTRCCIT